MENENVDEVLAILTSMLIDYLNHEGEVNAE